MNCPGGLMPPLLMPPTSPSKGSPITGQAGLVYNPLPLLFGPIPMIAPGTVLLVFNEFTMSGGIVSGILLFIGIPQSLSFA